MADFPHSFLAHMREGAEQLAEPDVEDVPDAFSEFVEGRKLAGALGSNRAAANITLDSGAIDREFAEKIRKSREADPAQACAQGTIAKADHGEHGTRREKCADGRTKVTVVDADGMKVFYE